MRRRTILSRLFRVTVMGSLFLLFIMSRYGLGLSWIVVLRPGFGCFHIILGLFNCLVHGRNLRTKQFKSLS